MIFACLSTYIAYKTIIKETNNLRRGFLNTFRRRAIFPLLVKQIGGSRKIEFLIHNYMFEIKSVFVSGSHRVGLSMK